MPPARPLRDVFAELSGTGHGSALDARNPDAVLADAGHPQLPAGLVAEAVVSYADTAPIEVAEHLAPYVMAHSAVPTDVVGDVDEPHWLDVLSAAPDPAVPVVDDHPGVPVAEAPDGTTDAWFGSGATDGGFDLDFGHGAAGTDASLDHGHGTHDAHPGAGGDGTGSDGTGGEPDGPVHHGDPHALDAPLDDLAPHEGHGHPGYLDHGGTHDAGHLHGDPDAADHHDLPGGHDGW